MKQKQADLIKQIQSYHIEESQELHVSDIYAIINNEPESIMRLGLAYNLGYIRAMQSKAK